MNDTDFDAVINAIDSLSDGTPIEDGPKEAYEMAIHLGGSIRSAELARAIVRLVVRSHGKCA